MSESHTLVLPFDSDDREFARGFEAGLIWSITAASGCFSGIVLAANAEMVIRIAESFNLPFRADDTASEHHLRVHIGHPETCTCED